jgi:NADPH:quinone reductase-like Zn-dependent oxidoreductase
MVKEIPMKAIVYRKYGSRDDALEVRDIEKPAVTGDKELV